MSAQKLIRETPVYFHIFATSQSYRVQKFSKHLLMINQKRSKLFIVKKEISSKNNNSVPVGSEAHVVFYKKFPQLNYATVPGNLISSHKYDKKIDPKLVYL